MENKEIIFGRIYRVFYKDNTEKFREKIMRLDHADNAFYFFHNTQTGKGEALPKRVIDRMEEVIE